MFEAAGGTNRQAFGLPLPPPPFGGPGRGPFGSGHGPGGPKKDAPGAPVRLSPTTSGDLSPILGGEVAEL